MTTEPLQDSTESFHDFTVHFLGSLTVTASASTLGCGRITEYGQEMRITEALRTINTDRNGDCWLDLVDNEPAQVARWGRRMFARGPWPEGEPRIEHGSPAWQDAREAARQEAWRIEDPAARAARLQRSRASSVSRSRPLAPSRTIAHYDGAHRG